MIKFRKWILAVAALAVVLACSEPTRSAEDKKPKKKRQAKLIAEEGAIEVVLLRHKAVQDDLKLEEKERKAITDFAAKQWKKAQEVGELDKDKQEAKWKEMTKENRKFLKDNLTKAQNKRLEQIGMQTVGLMWVNRRDIAKELGLTADQRKKAREYQKKAHEEFSEAVHAEKKEGVEEKLKELRETNRKRLMSVLTDDQKEKWKKLAGDPFKGDLSDEK